MFKARHTLESVAAELSAGLARGTIVLPVDSDGPPNPEGSASSRHSHRIGQIVVINSDPDPAVRLCIAGEVRDIQHALGRESEGERISIFPKWAVRPDDLIVAMSHLHLSIVHFCGHGATESGLVLEDTSGTRRQLSASSLGHLFARATSKPRCVVLEGCSVDDQATVISRFVPYVIGTVREIGEDASHRFTRAFYEGLGRGESIEVAFEAGKTAIDASRLPEGLSPKIYKRVS